MKGLTDPIVGLLMGQTAENLAFRFGITRREMDEFAARSHARVIAAQKAGHFAGEVVPLFDANGKLYAQDDGVREDSTPDNLAKLQAILRPQVRQRHRRQQLADHRRRSMDADRVRARGRQAQADAARAHRRFANGRVSIPRRWALGPYMRPRRS